jgi:hypothetical protein
MTTYDTPLRTAQIPTWTRGTVMKVWAAAVPMGMLPWVAAPLLAQTLSGPTAVPRALILSLGAGLIWQFALVLIAVRREQGFLSWPVAKKTLRLNAPLSPRSGKRNNRLSWMIIPLMVLLALEEFLLALPTPATRDAGLFFVPDAGQSFMSVNCVWFVILIVQFHLRHGSRRGAAFPGSSVAPDGHVRSSRLAGDGLLSACYHLHEPWVIPQTFLVYTFADSLPSRRRRSSLLGMAVHSGQTGLLHRDRARNSARSNNAGRRRTSMLSVSLSHLKQTAMDGPHFVTKLRSEWHVLIPEEHT